MTNKTKDDPKTRSARDRLARRRGQGGAPRTSAATSGPTPGGEGGGHNPRASRGALLEPPRSISDQVYEFIRKDILSRAAAPGQRLLEQSVTEAYQVSRTPVREAFRRLEMEGLVVRLPQGGVRVTEVSRDDLDEILDIRAMVEIYAGQRACRRVRPEDIAELKGIVAQARLALEGLPPDSPAQIERLSALNTAFHDAFYRIAGSPYLMKILEIVRLPMLRLRSFSLMDERRRAHGWREHCRMIDLLQSGDRQALARLIRGHVQAVGAAVRKSWERMDRARRRAEAKGKD